MIPQHVEIQSGVVVRHDDGLRYRVEDVRHDMTQYERTRRVGWLVVNYSQLDDGEYPPGSHWSKHIVEFRKYFTIER